jgi:hypothetical protein
MIAPGVSVSASQPQAAAINTTSAVAAQARVGHRLEIAFRIFAGWPTSFV